MSAAPAAAPRSDAALREGDRFLLVTQTLSSPLPRAALRLTRAGTVALQQWVFDNAIAVATARGNAFARALFETDREELVEGKRPLPPALVEGAHDFAFGVLQLTGTDAVVRGR